MIIVNNNNKLPRNYLSKINLINVGDRCFIEENTYNSFIKLKKYLEKNTNIKIDIDNDLVNDDYDEHKTCLLIDLKIKIDDKVIGDIDLYPSYYINYLSDLYNNLYKFGFIIRYQDSIKTIRYVGCIPAKIMKDNNLSIEEYINDFGCILFIDKEKDKTSFDVVNDIRHIFDLKKVGHSGTLDPIATGMLVVAVGKYTKLIEDLTSTFKEYTAEIKIGIKTDTGDITGNIVDKSTNKLLKKNLIEVLKKFPKKYTQTVPKYSAKKVNGKKLYEYARNNETVELPTQEVEIKELELIDFNDNYFTIKTQVSKGTYIRSLIEDIGDKLNICLTMSNLRRTKQGKFDIENANIIEDIKNNNFKYYNVTDIFDYPIIEVDLNTYKDIKNGKLLENTYNIKDKVIFKYKNNYSIYVNTQNNMLKVYKNNL